jgi:hypothetical protein
LYFFQVSTPPKTLLYSDLQVAGALFDTSGGRVRLLFFLGGLV